MAKAALSQCGAAKSQNINLAVIKKTNVAKVESMALTLQSYLLR